jgi:hypothetical protein
MPCQEAADETSFQGRGWRGGFGVLAWSAAFPNLGRREPAAALAAMDRIRLLLADQPPHEWRGPHD